MSSSLGTNEIARYTPRHTPEMLATDEPVDDLETRLSARFSQAMQKQQETMDAQQKELETLRAELEKLQQATIKKEEIKKEPHEEASVDPEHGPFWSLNAIAVACWKSACWPKGKSWNEEKREFEDLPFERKLSPWEHSVKNLCWTVWYNVFPVLYTIMFLCTLCAIMDEGNNTKGHIFGDWWYQSPVWRIAKNSEQRAQSFTERGVLTDRPQQEIDSCLGDDFLMPFNTYDPTNDTGYVRLWALVDILRGKNASGPAGPGTGPGTWYWGSTHCLPWELAGLCAAVYEANAAVDGKTLPHWVREEFVAEKKREAGTGMETAGSYSRRRLQQAQPPARTWYPTECYPLDYHRVLQLTAADWQSLVVRSAQDLRDAAKDKRLPNTIDTQAKQDVALWIMTRIVCDEKTLDTRDDRVSMHLYQRLHYVYEFGIGESSAVELITIIILSLFLFYSSFFAEVSRTLGVITLSVTMRNYEGAMLGEVGTSCDRALRASVLWNDSKGKRAKFYVWLLTTDCACDIFLALRLLVLSQLTIASIMFVVLQHGVINVIFSILAVAFAMDIDAKFNEMLTTFGFAQSPLYALQLKPALAAIMTFEARSLSSHRKGVLVEKIESQSILSKIAHFGQLQYLWGLPTSHWWALILTSALLLDHQFWSLSIAINSGPSTLVSQLNACFQEFVGIPHQLVLTLVAGFGAAFFNTVAYHGIVAVPALAQLGLCTLWVYAILRNFTLLGVLSWYSDVHVNATFLTHVLRNISEDSLFVYPALGLYATLAVVRPALLILFCRADAAESKLVDVKLSQHTS